MSEQVRAKVAPAPGIKRKRHRWTRDDTELGLLGLPTFIWYVLFSYLPMFGLIIAFKKYQIFPRQSFLANLFMSDWVGFDNFKFFINNNTFGMLLRNTLLYNLVFIIINLVVPVTLAIVINQLFSKMASKCYQTLMFFPYFMSWVVVSYFVYAFLNPDRGLANTIITALGGEKIMWYSSPQYWPFILVFMSTWKSMGYNMVVYLASITGIDTTMYEAAILDGATKWQQAKYITIPTIRPMIIMMFILNIGHIFYSDFGLFYQVPMQSGSLYPVTQTIDTYVFRGLLQLGNVSMSSAAGVYQSLVGFVLVLGANLLVRKLDPESALF